MATVTIEYGQGDQGHLECYQDIDMQIVEKIQVLLGMEMEDKWQDLCVRLAEAVKPTPCAGKNAKIASILEEIDRATANVRPSEQ